MPPNPSSRQEADPSNRLDPKRWVDEHGTYLYRYALSRVRNPGQAEELLQETFLAALKGADRFGGRSTERTWLTGILKFKIMDHYRRSAKTKNFTDLDFFTGQEEANFLQDGEFAGGWKNETIPLQWEEKPGRSLDREEFWAAFHACTGKLPRVTAQVFLLRDVDEVSSASICEQLDISPNNLWVMLHRARMALRECLESTWIKPTHQTPPAP